MKRVKKAKIKRGLGPSPIPLSQALKVVLVLGLSFFAHNKPYSSTAQPLPSSSSTFAADLQIVWQKAGTRHPIKSWNMPDLLAFKRIASREKDPQTGQPVNWQGVLLSHVIEKALEALPLESRAQIDLVVLRNDRGDFAPIPRFLIARYPFLLALNTDRGNIFSVAPWSSKPSILKEVVPIEKYFVSNISQIDLTSDQDQYPSLFLKRRTDPSAMKGEKLFVQNCALCHQLTHDRLDPRRPIQMAKEGDFLSMGHPFVNVVFKLTEKDRKSVVKYLNAYRQENSSPGTTAFHFTSRILGSSFSK